MNFNKALECNIITQDEYDLLAMINKYADELESDMLTSEKLNDIIERCWQFERTGMMQ
jgi:hypothetical protein